jgi:UDP-N-acetylmuramate: L-alanyl-gamma-D-glutamyl-meso-diaminopimelate ligase
VLLAPLGRSGLPVAEQLDLGRLARDLGPKAQAMPDVASIVERLAQNAAPGDTIAVLSNGAFGGIHPKLLDALARPRTGAWRSRS